jgi:hypothetical protein
MYCRPSNLHVSRDTTEFQLISTAPVAKVLQHIASNPLSVCLAVSVYLSHCLAGLLTLSVCLASNTLLFVHTARDTTELQLISTAPGAKVLQHIASNPLSNINSVEFHPNTWEPQIVSAVEYP